VRFEEIDLMIKQQSRVEWWDGTTGCHVIAEMTNGNWKFFEKESGGVRWYPVTGTSELMRIARALSSNERAKAERTAA
jgi:hypothetical protein